MSVPAAIQQAATDDFGGVPPTLVAFGQITAPGTTAPVSIAGGAGIYIWGLWEHGLLLTVSRSTDGGITWTDTVAFQSNYAVSDQMVAASSALAAALPTGTALYRLRLDAPFNGTVVNWAAYQ